MKVPILDQQVGLQPPQASDVKIPGPVEGASGINVDEALSGAGKSVENLGDIAIAHIQRQNYWRTQEQVYDLSNKFHVDTQNAMFGNDVKTIKGSDGQNYDIPNGVLNRNGTQAHGATVDFDNTMLGLKAQYMGKIDNPYAQKMLSRLIDSEYNTSREQVIKHESTQLNNAAKKTFESSLTNQANQAAIAQDPKSLSTVLDTGVDTVNRMADRTGLDDDSKFKRTNDWLAKAVDTSTNNLLTQSGDLSKAQDLLESVKDRVTLDDYDKISNKLQKGAESMQRMAVRTNDLRQNKNALDLLSGISSGKINWQNLNDIDKTDVPEPFKMAVKSALNAKLPAEVDTKSLGFVPSKDKQFVQHLADVLKGEDQNQVVTTMASALNNFGHGKISQNNLNVLTKLAMMRGNSLPCKEDVASGDTINPKQVGIDAGIRSLMKWSDKSGINSPELYGHYIDDVNKGIDPKTAHDNAIKNAVTKEYPGTISQDSTPQMVVGKRESARVLFPIFNKDAKIYPTRNWVESKKESGNPLDEVGKQENKIADRGA